MYHRSFYKTLAILFMCVLSNNAFALTCERTSRSTEGFTSSAAFDSWFPKEMNFDEQKFVEAGKGSKALVFAFDAASRTGNLSTMTYRLLPNGKLIAKKSDAARYAKTGHVRYKCNKNSNEVRQLIASGNAANTNSTNSSSSGEKSCFDGNVSVCTSEQLCNRATSRRTGVQQWDSLKQFQPYVAEAKSRGLTCGVGDGSSDTNNSSTSKLDKAKSTCTELGFTLGTEKHGDCVLKMMDN